MDFDHVAWCFPEGAHNVTASVSDLAAGERTKAARVVTPFGAVDVCSASSSSSTWQVCAVVCGCLMVEDGDGDGDGDGDAEMTCLWWVWDSRVDVCWSCVCFTPPEPFVSY